MKGNKRFHGNFKYSKIRGGKLLTKKDTGKGFRRVCRELNEKGLGVKCDYKVSLLVG